MLRRLLSIIAGILAGIIVVIAGDNICHLIWPPPTDLDLSDQRLMTEFVGSIPFPEFLLMLCFWLLSSLTGGFVAGKINSHSWKFSSIVTSCILLAAASLNMFMLPHPLWMVVASVILYIPAGYLGGKIANR